MDPAAEARRTLLLTHLQAAVPLEIDRLRAADADTLAAAARDAVAVVAERGDVLQYGGPGAGRAVAALTRALAVLALTAWGGVTFAGLHWCATPTCRDRNAPHDAPIRPDTARIDPPGRRRPVVTVPTGGRT